MRFISYEHPAFTLGPIFWISLVLAIAIGFFIFRSTEGEDRLYKLVPYGLVAATLIALFTVAIPFNLQAKDQIDAWKARIISSVQKTYGVELSDDERMALQYPSEKPKGDYEVFGSFETVKPSAEGFLKKVTYLIWQDEKMILAESTDGENFEPLEAQQ